MARSLVSVIIPCYNSEEYIAETIRSALAQSLDQLEIIVIDDGSTDGSLDEIRKFGDSVICQTGPNRGGCAARNHGISLASGKYIQFLDADDLISPTKLACQFDQLEREQKLCVSVSNVVYFHDHEDPGSGQLSKGYPALNSDDPINWLLELWTPGAGYGSSRWGMVPPHAYLVPRQLVGDAGPWDESLTIDQDGEYFARILACSEGVRWEQECYAYYRKFRNRQSVSRGRGTRQIQDRVRGIELKIKTLEKQPKFEWTADWRRVVARMFMSEAVMATPLLPRVAFNAYRRAKAFGGYDPKELIGRTGSASRLIGVLPWPIFRALQELRRMFRKTLRDS